MGDAGPVPPPSFPFPSVAMPLRALLPREGPLHTGSRRMRAPRTPRGRAALLLPASSALLVGAFFLLPAGASGQGGNPLGTGEFEGPPRAVVGGALLVGQPLGEFRDYVPAGFGLDGFGRLALDPEGWIGLRVDVGFLIYGSETRRVCLSETVGCRIEVELTTSNQIFMGGIGPELQIPLGSRGGGVYGGLSAGFSWFSTDSRVRGTGNVGEQPFASTVNFSDGGFAWTASGGVRVPLVGGSNPVALDLGVRRVGNGRREYLTEGDIVDLPGGEIELNVRRSDADLLLWRVGVSVGVRSH